DDRSRTAIYQGGGELSRPRWAGGRYLTLRGDGRQQVLAGETSWEEVVRVTESRVQEEE
ncbi:type II secretion system protein GspE, partial [Escherichia coli]